MDCGPTCLRMIAKHYGKHYSLQTLREKSHIDREGVSLMGISDAAENIGFQTLPVRLSFNQLQEEVPLPCIAHWKQQHFVVVYKIKGDTIYVADPAFGLVTYTKEEFLKGWISTKDTTNTNAQQLLPTLQSYFGQEGIKFPMNKTSLGKHLNHFFSNYSFDSNNADAGILLLLETTPNFFKADDEEIDKTSFGFLFRYLSKYTAYIWQLFLGLLLGSLLQLVFPFLTQAVVDIGINNQDLNFVYLILIAQLMLFGGRTAVEFIRSWILLHVSTRINISLISDFLLKLMKLPIGFFDSKMTGDLLQRINDHKRIESFLTNSSLNTLFSLINLVVFGVVLAIYDTTIFAVFLGGSLLHIAWVAFFLKKRRELDFKRFDQLAANQSSLIQLITGMQEIKLNNYEKQKRWEWEKIQAALFQVNVKGLQLEQYQQIGALVFNEVKNILITFIAAKAVIEGDMTLGMMMAVSYIIGQLNAPIAQLIQFLKLGQDAKISLERLGEIHNKKEEDSENMGITIMPEKGDLNLENLSFQYGGPQSEMVLKDINLQIPKNKITAIVGTSGSGKTTLVKLLLKFYESTKGKIQLGDTGLNNIQNRLWRNKCGAVMQDGFIFSESIARNIAVSDEIIDKRKLLKAVKAANIQQFIESLPLGYNTKIGQEGIGLSGGQKQRILIARAIYKNPDYIFFDEATSALDAKNERIIMENLEEFYKGRTVVIVAHRLSTVQNADQIVVLEAGELVEQGTHEELVAKRGNYYTLVKNQLELGS